MDAGWGVYVEEAWVGSRSEGTGAWTHLEATDAKDSGQRWRMPLNGPGARGTSHRVGGEAENSEVKESWRRML